MSNINDLSLMAVMFVCGGAFRLYEEHLLQRYLRVALSLSRLNREENEQLAQKAVQQGFFYICIVTVLFFVSPERLLDRLKRDFASHRAPSDTRGSSIEKPP